MEAGLGMEKRFVLAIHAVDELGTCALLLMDVAAVN